MTDDVKRTTTFKYQDIHTRIKMYSGGLIRNMSAKEGAQILTSIALELEDYFKDKREVNIHPIDYINERGETRIERLELQSVDEVIDGAFYWEKDDLSKNRIYISIYYKSTEKEDREEYIGLTKILRESRKYIISRGKVKKC